MSKPARDVRPGDHIVTGSGSVTGDGSIRTGIVRGVTVADHWGGAAGDWRVFTYRTHNPGRYEHQDGYVVTLADSPVELVQETP